MNLRHRLLSNFGHIFPKPQLNGRIYLKAPISPISVQRDKHGIVYIGAHTRKDLFFGQGFTHAQDRLWQLELNRRAAHGTLSELFGKRTLHTDRLSRTLGFTRLAHTTLNLLSSQAQTDLEAYSDGINAFLDSRAKRPFEFQLLHHTPQPWQPIDSLAYGRLQMWALTTGASSELIYAQLQEAVGIEKANEWAHIYPAENPITLPHFQTDIQNLHIDPMFNDLTNGFAPFMGKGKTEGRGSNGWVIGKDLTESGLPLLANDMHLPLSVPSTWHVQHLESADGFKAAGFSQPGLPYIMIGHNEYISWGATMAYTDGEDLFLEQFDDSRPLHYKYQKKWHKAEVVEEKICIRGSQPIIEAIAYTKHGPIISQSLVKSPTQTKISLCSVALIPELTMDGFGLLNEAQDWFAFKTAVSRIQAPALNLLYADKKGNIGYALTGKHPIRPKGVDGTLPNEGWHGKHDWIGLISSEQNPAILNPPPQKIISANHKILPKNCPHFLGIVWRNGYRAKRIETLLDGDTAVTPQKCCQIQTDTYSIPARLLCVHLSHLKPNDPLTQQCLNKLLDWDYKMSRQSISATIFQTFIVHLTQSLQSSLPQQLAHKLLGLGPHENLQPVNDFQGQLLVTLIKMLDNPKSQWMIHANKNALLLGCLEKTAVSLQQKFGNNQTNWRWGKNHHITLRHPLGIIPPLSQLLNVGPIAISGDGYTIQQTSMHPYTTQQLDFQNNAISVSSRMIADLSDWNNFQLIHVPGQSGHWQNKQYDNLGKLWENGRLITLPWDGTKINQIINDSLLLLPQKEI